jgi:hypothetical protein
MNLTKDVKGLYNRLKKEVEKDTIRWKDFPYCGLAELILWKWLYFKVMYRFNATSIIIMKTFFTELENK